MMDTSTAGGRRTLAAWDAFRLLAHLYIRRSILRPRSLLLIALVCINALLSYAAADSADPNVMSAHMADVFFGFLLPAMCLLLGVGVIRDEADAGTIGYLLLRPVSRLQIYVSRLIVASLCSAIFAGICASCSILILPVPVNVLVGQIVSVSVLGGIVFTVLFAAFGVVFNRPFLLGVGWLIGIERLLATASFQGRYGSVSAHLQTLSGLPYMPGTGLITKFVDPVTPEGSIVYLLTLTTCAFLAGHLVFQRKEYAGDTPSD